MKAANGEDLDCDGDYIDWQFIAEGRLHVVFFNRNKNSIYYNDVLKIPKVQIKKICRIPDSTFYEYDAYMVQNIMSKWFSRGYIQDIQRITLSVAFIEYIVNAYNNDGTGRSKNLVLTPFAYIERNLLKVKQPIPPSHSHLTWMSVSKVISFEFKVKCGLRSISPFNKSSRRLKLKYSRFAMMQVLKKEKAVRSGDVVNEMSAYRPDQLCSKDTEMVFDCLKTLLRHPQNNLKVSLNGKHKFGWGKTDCTALHNTCSYFLESDVGRIGVSSSGSEVESETESDSDIVLSLICKVLSENSLLLELQRMQLLDILDSEGAAIVYGRLVEVAGSTALADDCILAHIASPDFGIHVLPDLIALSRDMMERGTYTLEGSPGALMGIELCGDNDSNSRVMNIVCRSCAGKAMRSLLQLAVHEEMGEQEILSRSAAAFKIVQGLSAEVCADLLVVWMMGLVAKDASVIVSLQPLRSEVEENNAEQSNSALEALREAIRRGRGRRDDADSSPGLSLLPLPLPLMNYFSSTRPTELYSGVLNGVVNTTTSVQDIRHLPSYAYSMGVIDVGMKPLDKIYKRYLEEESLVQATARWISNNKVVEYCT